MVIPCFEREARAADQRQARESEGRTDSAKTRSFNKQESDFVSPAAYNAYLEEVESWTFKLLHELDVEETERNIRKYLEENADSIEANQDRGEEERKLLKEREEAERREKEEQRRRYEELDEEERRAKEEERKAVLEALVSSRSARSAPVPPN